MLEVAQQMFAGSAIIFTFILLAGIYTTAVPLLWVAINRIERQDRSKKAKILAVIGTTVALLLAQIPFASFVNILYPIGGYVTQILLICIVVRQIRNHRDRKRGLDVYDVPFERLDAKA